MTSSLFERLSYRQARNTVAVAVALGVCATGLALLHDARREREAVAETTVSLVRALSAPAAKAAYDFDGLLAAQVLDGLFNYDPTFDATLEDDGGQILADRRRPLEQSQLRWLSEALFGGAVRVRLPLEFTRPERPGVPLPVGALSVAVDTHRVAAAFLERAGASIVSGLVSNLLLGLVLGLMFQRAVTDPLLSVARALATLRPERLDGQRLAVPKGHERTEIGALVTRTNELLERYDATLRQRDRITEDLDAARGRAEEASRTKSMFLATISHEVRTPLNAIIGFSQIIRDDSPKQGPHAIHADFAEEIHTSGNRLLTIINDILDLSNLETGRFSPRPEPLEVRPLLETCARLTQPRADQAGLTLVVEADPATPRLLADPRAVRQILLHLLSNAVKFTPCGGRVTLAAQPTATGVALAVSDTGVGIDAADLPRVFQPFWQAAPVLTRRYEGTGLGLTMVKALVDLHDGMVAVDSTPGQGTTVTVVLPTARVQAALSGREASPAL